MSNWNRMYEESLPDHRLPINVLPYANEEFLPARPTAQDFEIYRTAMRDITEAAAHHGLSRRRFLQTGAAFGITLGAISKVMGGGYAFASHGDPGSCTDIDLHWPGAQMNNPPGEFVMDIQTHHVDADGDWRVTNPSQQAFFAAVWSQSSCGELDRVECLGQFHYVKELFLDSSTNVTVLSAVPFRPQGQPLPIEQAAETCGLVNALAGFDPHDPNSPGRRIVMHRFVMPNRGSLGNKSDSMVGLGNQGIYPVFMEEEFDLMEYTCRAFPEHIRAWKIYCPWGDVSYSSGWWLDDPVGIKFLEKVVELGDRYGVPKLVCAHKGFALTSFDQEKAATRDVGRVAPMFWDIGRDDGVSFVVYHSGYDGDGIGLGGPLNQGTSTAGPYPGDIRSDGSWAIGEGDESDEKVRSIDRGVDNFIKALRENGWSARHFAPGGQPGVPMAAGDSPNRAAHANVPNVYAELGSVWSAVMRNPARATYLLTKLLYYVGPKRVVWGTDSLWGGSPQGQIVGMRNFDHNTIEDTQIRALWDMYGLPHGLDGDVDDPYVNALDGSNYPDGLPHPEKTIRNGILGRNVAPVYKVDADAELRAVACDDLQAVRDEYITVPMAQYQVYGPRTPEGVWKMHQDDPWYKGARQRQNEAGFLKRLR
jgi:hypothetical protein